MAPLSVYGSRHRVDRRDDAVCIMAVCVWRLKQLRRVQDVHVRWLLPDEHEYHHRLLLRSIAGLYPLERPNESEIKAECASLAWDGGIVSSFQFWLGPLLVHFLRLSLPGYPPDQKSVQELV